MNSRNLNYYYYNEYFDGIDFEKPDDDETAEIIKAHNRELCSFAVKKEQLMLQLDESAAPHSIELTTLYPGLLIGTGLAHGFGGKGEAALGLCLDYVTGLPYIPGPSVKGVLRSAFVHREYIRELLSGTGAANAGSADIAGLEAGIFGNPVDKKKKQYDISSREQDTFFDAVIVSEGKILAADSITPHRQNKEMLELAAPNPITMIRIRPGVKIKFQFRLNETMGITAEQKLRLFKQILVDLGIGAKRNVGYGNLIEPEKALEFRNISQGTQNNADAETGNDASQRNVPGVCGKCGGPTKQNKFGQYYPYCFKCQNEINKNDQTGVRTDGFNQQKRKKK